MYITVPAIWELESLTIHAFSSEAVLSPDRMIHAQIHMYDDTIAEFIWVGEIALQTCVLFEQSNQFKLPLSLDTA